MKIKMHYMFGKKNRAVCGKRDVLLSCLHNEITCKLCLRTVAHKTAKVAFCCPPRTI